MRPEERALVDGARKRGSEADDGPWEYVNLYGRLAIIQAGKRDAIFGHYGAHPRNAEFAAHARQDVPALCDLADRQEAEIAAKDARIAELEAEKSAAQDALIDCLNRNHIEPVCAHTLESAARQLIRWAEMKKRFAEDEETKRIAIAKERDVARGRIAELEAELARRLT